MVDYVNPSRTISGEVAATQGSASAVPTMNYQRLSEKVTEPGSKAVAVRGTLEVRGRTFDTIERAGGYVYLRASTIPYLCHMEESVTHNKRHQIRVVHAIQNSRHHLANILIHAGNKPSHFVGCIGVGKRSGQGIAHSHECMAQLFELLGGFKTGTEVWLQVWGDMVEI